jgi:hypothetical protein
MVKEGGTLIISILSVESSYKKNKEIKAIKHHDILQWWVTNSGASRIKTYSLDQDIHIYYINKPNEFENLIKLAKSNNQKHYSDIIIKNYEFKIEKGMKLSEFNNLLKTSKLNPHSELFNNNHLIWLPDNREYKTITTPSKG